MKNFLDEDFLLNNKTAQQLFHDFAKAMPIIDYHCHLPPQQIADDAKFDNLTQLWLNGDHYKWRAMRTNGVDESYITGSKTDFEKFEKWAETVPYTLRNPLYHWTHLELQRYFDIYEIVNAENAKKIYDECSEKLKSPEYSVRNLLRKMKVQVVCTTDDPADTLSHHQKIKDDQFEIKILPTFRPDKAMHVDDANAFNQYVNNIESASNIGIKNYDDYLSALKQRHDFFSSNGCVVSDHGLEHLYAEGFSEQEINSIFQKIRSGNSLNTEEKNKFKSAILIEMAIWDWEKGWVQQFHLGALRNNNSRLLKSLGADTGWDSIGDFPQGKMLSKFLDGLDKNN